MISIIVPVYNVADYLEQCVESIVCQTYKDIEIILVDDGSTDESADICEKYKKCDERVKVVHKANGGLVSARKAGLAVSHGQYIAYVDGDDWIEPDMYERMYRKLVDYDVDMVMCGRYEDLGNVRREVFHGIREGRYGKAALLKEVYPKMIVNSAFFEWGLFPGVWDKLFKRECLWPFQMAVDDQIRMGEDAACTYPCLLNADSIFVLHECLYHYRQRPESMVREIRNFREERASFQLLYKFVDDALKQYVDIYNLCGQWRDYMLFLMLPRADALYMDMEKLDYLFPYPKVRRGSRVIIYGAGVYGKRLYRYLKTTGYCSVVALVDRDYAELQKQGVPAVSLEDIGGYEYDAIVIAIVYAKARNTAYQDLVKKYPDSRIFMIDEKLAKNRETVHAFGLA